jgi:RNA polymerase sigma factor (sigma-70 family)
MGDSSGTEDEGDEAHAPSSAAPMDFEAAYKVSRKKLTGVAAAVLRAGGLESQADDVVSDAIIELLPRRKAMPASWEAVMVSRVKWRAMDRLRAAKKVADPSPVRNREGEDDESEDERLNPTELYDPTDDIIDSVDLRANMKQLQSQEREVLFRVYRLHHTQTEVAQELGLTRGRVSQIHRSGVEKLRDLLQFPERR